jgi:ABC-type sugar transport system ATPase subunit
MTDGDSGGGPAVGVLPGQSLGVEVRGIAKQYGGARALDDVSLQIAPGAIHALVGENGAGKSTLGKIIAGDVSPDRGEMFLNGERMAFRSPRDAIKAGIALIHQETALVPTLSVLDNVFLGAEKGRGGLLDRTSEWRQFDSLCERIGFAHPASMRVGNLRVADQQKVEILRALVRNARLIVMDEPTAALTRNEADRLLEIARDLREGGVTIVYVSHFLSDVLGLCDTITVLKDGRHVKTAAASGETVGSLVTAMLGRSMDLVFPPLNKPASDAPVVLSVENLARPPDFADISFQVRAGEIVGLAGLVGSGRSEIVRAIFGADPATGKVTVAGKLRAANSPRNAIRNGIALVPESRKDQGLVMIRPVRENVSLAHLDVLSWHGYLLEKAETETVDRLLRDVDARLASAAMPVSSLSGGNQQKVSIAKWLVKSPAVLLADEPTRGIDVGAKRTVYKLIHRLASEGLGIVLISSELEEVLGLAHRILVVREGRIVAQFEGDDTNEEQVMRAAFGDTDGTPVLVGAT